MINSKIVGANWGTRFSLEFTGLFAVVLLSGTLFLHAIGVTTTNGVSLVAALAVSIASIGALLHGLFRSIILAVKSNLAFNLITILPLVVLCAVYLVWHPSDYKFLVWGYVVAQVSASLVAIFVLWNSLSLPIQASRVEKRMWIGIATRYGSWSFLTTMFTSFLNVAAFSIMRQSSLSDAIVGQFSISLLFLSASLVPLNMVIPVLFDTWSKEKELGTIQQSYVKLSHIGLLLSVGAVLGGFFLIRMLTQVVFGVTYLTSVPSTQVLLISIYALYQNRLLSAILLSTGKPKVVAYGTVVKLITLALIFFGLANSLVEIAWAWNIGEIASMCFMALAVKTQTRWSTTYVFGVSPSWIISNVRAALINYR
jgi:O-antigen/teichoic acid export membrane protein